MPLGQTTIVDETVLRRTEALQKEVSEIIQRFSLTVSRKAPAIELQSFPYPHAIIAYVLGCEAGFIVLRGKLRLGDSLPVVDTPFPVTVRFSLSHELDDEIEAKKRLIEEILDPDAELIWGIPPVGHSDHVELTLTLPYHAASSQLSECCACILGILTGNVQAA